eukprot:4337953-Amphidinium_carterae.2
MFDAHHIVVIAVPLYAASAKDVACDFAEQFGAALGQAQIERPSGAALVIALHEEYTGFVVAPDLVAGGAKHPSTKRQRSASHDGSSGGDIAASEETHVYGPLDIFWPVWKPAVDNPTTLVHVSVGDNVPLTISVPRDWALDEIEDALAKHVCCRRDWIDFVWAGSDVAIDYAPSFPLLTEASGIELAQVFQEMPTKTAHRRSRTHGSEVIIGHRASRKRGVSVYTTRNPEAARACVAKATELVPDAVFNAIALVWHASTPVHRDSTNKADSQMVLIPQTPDEVAWLWVEAKFGSSPLNMAGRTIFGSWLPYDRVYSFNSVCAHQIESESLIGSMVLYRTEREPKAVHLSELVHYGFPLSVSELAVLSAPAPEVDITAVSDDSCAESEDLPSDAPLLTSACCTSPPEQQPVQGPAASVPVASSMTMLKASRDGTLREEVIRTPPGSTVAHARQVLKRYLKLNIAKIAVAKWDAQNQVVDLQEHDVLDSESGPYLIRIKPTVGARPRRKAPRQQTVRTPCTDRVSASPQRRPIGASSSHVGAPQSRTATTGRSVQSGQRPAIGAPGTSVRKPASETVQPDQPAAFVPNSPALQRLIDDEIVTSSFERWAAGRIQQLEAQHDQILFTLTDLCTQLQALRPVDSTSMAAGAPWRSSSNRGPLVQGGAPRAPVDAVSSAASMSGRTVVSSLTVVNSGVRTSSCALVLDVGPSVVPPPPGSALSAEAPYVAAHSVHDFGLAAAQNSLWDYTIDTVTVGSTVRQTLDSSIDHGYVPVSAHTSNVGLGCSSLVNTLYGEVFDSDIDDCYSPNSIGTSRQVSFATLDQVSDCSEDSVVADWERESACAAYTAPRLEMHALPVPSGPPRILFPDVQGGAARSCGLVSHACILRAQCGFRSIGLVHGGMPSRLRRSCMLSTTTPSGHSILYVPCSSVRDSLMDCVLWVLRRSGWHTRHCAQESRQLFRIAAQAWLRQAHRHHWMCAGALITDLAGEADCSVEDFLENRCDPTLLSAPAYVIVYALSCVYAVQLCVLDRHGQRVDGYDACAGHAIQWMGLSWVVVTPTVRARPATCMEASMSISPTLPFTGISISSDLSLLVDGGGKRQRVCQQSLEQVVVTKILADAAFMPNVAAVLPRALAEHLARADPRFVRAAFQSVDMCQRLTALAAALSRAGLSSQWEAVAAAAASIRASSQTAQGDTRSLSPCQPSSATCSTVVRSSGSQCAVQAESDPRRPSSPSVKTLDLDSRLRAVEMWAHAVDAMDASLAVGSDAYAALVAHIDERVAATVNSSLADSRLSAAGSSATLVPESRVECLPQPGDGMCLFHAIAAGLGGSQSGVEIRDELTAFAASNSQCVIAGAPLSDWKVWEADDHNISNPSDAASRNWGGAVEMALCAMLKQVDIRVFEKRASNSGAVFECVATFHADTLPCSRVVSLLYTGRQHFDLLNISDPSVVEARRISALETQITTIASKVNELAAIAAAAEPKWKTVDRIHRILTAREFTLKTPAVPSSPLISTPLPLRVQSLEEAVQRLRLQSPVDSIPQPAGAPSMAAQQTQLFKLHTDAIAQTWHWTSSLLLAMNQQRSTNLQVQQALCDLEERVRMRAGSLLQCGAGVSAGASTCPAAPRDDTGAFGTLVLPSAEQAERNTEVDQVDECSPQAEQSTAAVQVAECSPPPGLVASFVGADARPFETDMVAQSE